MIDNENNSSVPPEPEYNKNTVSVGKELGIANVLPATSWFDWSGGIQPPGKLSVGRDPLAPYQDELIYMLRRDGQARALLNLLTLPIRAAFTQSKWIEPDGGAAKETEFANNMWDLPSNAGGMRVSKSMFLRQTLLALAYGFSTFEIVRKYADTGPNKGKLVIDFMGYRDPRTVTFLVDDHGQFQGFRQVTNFSGRAVNVYIKPQDAWYFAANEEENPYYGVSYFEPAFQHYQAKRKLYYIGELAAQIAAVPGRIGKIPLSASPRQIDEFKRSLSNFAFNTAMVIPPNFEVDPMNNNSNFKFLELIDHHNTMMAGSIMAKFFQQEDRSVLIDNGKADASADLFVQMLEAIAAELSESWSTKLMPQFIDMNFGSGKYPIHKFAPLTDENKQAIMDLFELFIPATSLNVTPEFVRITEQKVAERLGYDMDWNDIENKEKEIAAKQQAQMEADAEAARQAQIIQAKTANGNGAPTPGQQNKGGNPAARKIKQPPGNPAAKKPVPAVATSYTSKEEQVEAVDQLVVLLSNLFQPDDIPEDYVTPEDELVEEVKTQNGEPEE